jgi:hypothetical protein
MKQDASQGFGGAAGRSYVQIDYLQCQKPFLRNQSAAPFT